MSLVNFNFNISSIEKKYFWTNRSVSDINTGGTYQSVFDRKTLFESFSYTTPFSLQLVGYASCFFDEINNRLYAIEEYQFYSNQKFGYYDLSDIGNITYTSLSRPYDLTGVGCTNGEIHEYNGKLYVFGFVVNPGTSEAIGTGDVLCYDISLNSWSVISTCPHDGRGKTLRLSTTEVIIVGNYKGSQTPQIEPYVYVFNLATNAWSDIISLYPVIPTYFFSDPAIFIIDNILHIWGGSQQVLTSTSQDLTNTHFTINLSSPTIVTQDNLPFYTKGGRFILIDGVYYLVGGIREISTNVSPYNAKQGSHTSLLAAYNTVTQEAYLLNNTTEIGMYNSILLAGENI